MPENTHTDDEDSDTSISIDSNDDTVDEECIDVQPPQPAQEETEPPQQRRSTRTRHPPIYYGMEQTNLTIDTPTSVKDVDESLEKEEWKMAMKAEMDSLAQNEVWDLVQLPPGKKVVGSKWVFKKKVGADGNVERYKARLVAQGYTQTYGDDYDCVLRYLKGTMYYGILYSKTGPDSCIGYTGADWAGDQDDRKSISDYMFLLCGGAISWKSQKQRGA